MRFTKEQIDALMAWLKTLPMRGYIDEPAHWKFLGIKKRKKTKKAKKGKP